MVSATFEIAVDNTDEIKRIAKENMKTALELIAQQAETNAVYEITVLGAVDTGNLRRNIEHGVDDDTAYIGTNVEYGKYVEYGTSRMPARPFLKQAVENHKAEYKKLMEIGMRGQ